jgi:hypothetical protein
VVEDVQDVHPVQDSRHENDCRRTPGGKWDGIGRPNESAVETKELIK